jgi:hypothetical protein
MAKIPISIRLDEEVLTWFRERFPNGYQSAMNDVLRDFVEREKLHEFMEAYREGRIEVGPPITAEELALERQRKWATKVTSVVSRRTRTKS